MEIHIFCLLLQVWCVESEEQQYQNWTVNSSQKKLDISALKPGKQYWITVAAVNGAGVGTPSDPHGFLISELDNTSTWCTTVKKRFPWNVCFLFRPTETWCASIRPHRRADTASGPAIDWQHWRPPVVHFNDCSCLSVPAPWQDWAPHTTTDKRWLLIFNPYLVICNKCYSHCVILLLFFFLLIGLSRLVGEDLIIKHR